MNRESILLETPAGADPCREHAERVSLCRFRVTGVSDYAIEGLARRRAEAFTRALFEATAGGISVRTQYSVGTSDRITMQVEYPRTILQSPTTRTQLTASLAASGFTFDAQPDVSDAESVERREMHELRAPAILVRANGRGEIGFNASCCRMTSVVALTPPTWFNPIAADELLAALSVAGVAGALEIELTNKALDDAGRIAMERLAGAWARGRIEVCDGRQWVVPGQELLDAIAEAARDWLENPFGVAPRMRVSSHLACSLGSVLRRAAFTARDWIGPNSAMLRVPPGAPVTDLAGWIPAAARFPCTIPTRPSTLILLAPPVPQPPHQLLPSDGVSLGTVSVGDNTTEVRLTARDRQRHMICVGSSGVGKSTLLARMIVADIKAGEGVCVVDPHGELSARVLERIPRSRVRDVFWLRPGLDGRTFGLNLLETRPDATGRTPVVLCNELFRVFDRLYDMHQVAGPIFEQYMRSSIALVLENTRGGGTLLDIVRLFENDDFRETLVKTCTNPVVADFWRKTAGRTTGEASLRSLGPYITSKLNQFVTNASVRSIVAQPVSTIDFRAAMDRNAIVLLDLSVGSLGVGDVQLLGMLALGKLFTAALERVADGIASPAFHVYADEAHLFATDTLAEIVSQARKGNLSFVLATQSLAQLKTSRHGSRLLESLLGNIGTFVVFRVGPFDAELIEPLFRAGLSRSDLERLADYHTACRLLVKGVPLESFVCRTWPLEPAGIDAARIVKKVRRRTRLYTRSIAEVEETVANWAGSGMTIPQARCSDDSRTATLT